MQSNDGQSGIIKPPLGGIIVNKDARASRPWILLVGADFPDALRNWSIAEVANTCLGDYTMYKMLPGESVHDTLRRALLTGELVTSDDAPLYILRRVGSVHKDANSPTGRRVDPV